MPKKRLNTATEPDADIASVAEALRSAISLPSGFRCLNPVCGSTELIHWGEDRGRPKLFCSPACRSAYEYERAELLLDLSVLEAALKRSAGTYRQQRMVESAHRQLKLALMRYPYEPNKNRSQRSGSLGADDAASMSGRERSVS